MVDAEITPGWADGYSRFGRSRDDRASVDKKSGYNFLLRNAPDLPPWGVRTPQGGCMRRMLGTGTVPRSLRCCGLVRHGSPPPAAAEGDRQATGAWMRTSLLPPFGSRGGDGLVGGFGGRVVHHAGLSFQARRGVRWWSAPVRLPPANCRTEPGIGHRAPGTGNHGSSPFIRVVMALFAQRAGGARSTAELPALLLPCNVVVRRPARAAVRIPWAKRPSVSGPGLANTLMVPGAASPRGGGGGSGADPGACCLPPEWYARSPAVRCDRWSSPRSSAPVRSVWKRQIALKPRQIGRL